MANWDELKQKAQAAADEFGSYDPTEAEIEFMSAITPEVVLALIGENERLQEKVENFKTQFSELHIARNLLSTLSRAGFPLGNGVAESILAVRHERDQLRAEVEALRGSCKALGRENTLLTRRAKKAERAVLWFASIRIGFLRPKWLVAVIESLKGGRADG